MPSSETTSVEDFYPRPPRGGRLKVQRPRRRNRAISIHALREEGDRRAPSAYAGRAISIHALREEGDPQFLAALGGAAEISIHALREEGDHTGGCALRPLLHFYPRPPRGGRLEVGAGGLLRGNISIHALREEGDEATEGLLAAVRISIHALREEGDESFILDRPACARFLSTPSARRATQFNDGAVVADGFLSTPSARRATAKTETKSLFSNKLYNILHEFRRALIYSGSKNYPNHAKRLKNPVRRCRKNAENSPFAPGRKTQNNSRPSCSKGG